MKDFDRVHKHYDNFMKFFKLYKVEEITDLLELKGNEIVVDIGGGTGRLAEYLKGKCKVVYVLDESQGMLSKIKAGDGVIAMLGDALNTKLDAESVDRVILSDVFHHIKEQSKLIEELHRILKKDGKLVILDFEKNNLKTKILKYFEYILFGRLYFRTSKEIIELLRERFLVTEFVDRGYYFLIRGEKVC